MGAWASARNVLGPFRSKGDQVALAAWLIAPLSMFFCRFLLLP